MSAAPGTDEIMTATGTRAEWQERLHELLCYCSDMDPDVCEIWASRGLRHLTDRDFVRARTPLYVAQDEPGRVYREHGGARTVIARRRREGWWQATGEALPWEYAVVDGAGRIAPSELAARFEAAR